MGLNFKIYRLFKIQISMVSENSNFNGFGKFKFHSFCNSNFNSFAKFKLQRFFKIQISTVLKNLNFNGFGKFKFQ
jgi:hypothetical protein